MAVMHCTRGTDGPFDEVGDHVCAMVNPIIAFRCAAILAVPVETECGAGIKNCVVAENSAQALPILGIHEPKIAAFQLLDFLNGEETSGGIHDVADSFDSWRT